MNSQEKVFTRKQPPGEAARLVQTIVGCKWSMTVYRLIDEGIVRPGEMVRAVDGLTTKVMNDCLRKNIGFGIIDRVAYNEVPPRVEYQLTTLGRKIIAILNQLDSLEEELRDETGRSSTAV